MVYAITTSAGIVLIDAGYADQLEAVLLPGMKTLGLDPNSVRYVLLGHGHVIIWWCCVPSRSRRSCRVVGG